MGDTLSKPSEHVRLCVEQIIMPYLGMMSLNCFSKIFKIVQFYCVWIRLILRLNLHLRKFERVVVAFPVSPVNTVSV